MVSYSPCSGKSKTFPTFVLWMLIRFQCFLYRGMLWESLKIPHSPLCYIKKERKKEKKRKERSAIQKYFYFLREHNCVVSCQFLCPRASASDPHIVLSCGHLEPNWVTFQISHLAELIFIENTCETMFDCVETEENIYLNLQN